MNRQRQERLHDSLEALGAIGYCLEEGDLDVRFIFDALRDFCLRSGSQASLHGRGFERDDDVLLEGVARTRVRRAHHYFDTSHELVVATVVDDIPRLNTAVVSLTST